MKKNIFYKVILLVVVAVFITACEDPLSGNGGDVVDTSLTIEDVLAIVATHDQSAQGISQITELLNTGDVNAKENIEEMTALMIAGADGFHDIVKALLAVDGINIDALNANSNTALIATIQKSFSVDIIETLLKAGANQSVSSSSATASVWLDRIKQFPHDAYSEQAYNDIKALLEQYQ